MTEMKLTRELKLACEAYSLNPGDWLLVKEGDVYATIVNRETGKTRRIDKYARAAKGGKARCARKS